MGRRPAASFSPVTWRDGIHLTGSPLWCDARRRRDVCFVSSAERVGRAGHGQVIGTPITTSLLSNTGGDLAVPLRQRFTLGTSRLELIPSGRGYGAAALHVDLAGRTVLYAGPVRTVSGGASEPAEVRVADAVVVAAPFGEAHQVFPPLAELVVAIAAWCRARIAEGHRPILAVDTALDGLEVATLLAAAEVRVSGGKALRDAVERLPATLGIADVHTTGKDRVLVALDSDRRPANAPSALVAGRAIDGHAGHAVGFAWSHAADRTQLLAWIEATRAKDVFVTGACAEAIVARLGPRARVLGPPQQMALFPREAS